MSKVGEQEKEQNDGKPKKVICPTISAQVGEKVYCMGEGCSMWIGDDEKLTYGLKNIRHDCGFKLLALYAAVETDRMLRYRELAE